MNEKQSLISKKFNVIFWGKVTTDCCYPNETLADTKDCLSNAIKAILTLIESEVNHREISIV